MDMTIDQQVALDEAIVPHASKLRIGKSNFRLKSDISSKESTLQLAYDVLRLTPFYKAFLVTSDVSEIYMQEFWATAMVHHHSISGEIRKLTYVNINKLHQPWRSFAAIINKCLSGKSTGYNSLRRNKVNWHYVKDDQMFTTIKLVSRHQNTQQFGAMFPIELTNADIRNSKAYKEYYAVTTGATPPKTKASVRKTKSSFNTTVTPPLTAVVGIRLSTPIKGKQPAKASKAKSLTVLSEVAMTEAEQLKLATKRSMQQTHISQASDESNDDDQDSDEEDKEFIHPKLSIHDEEETKDEESFDPIATTPENTDDEGNNEENIGLNVGMKEGQDEEDDENDLYGDVNINLEGRVVQMVDVHTTQEFEDSHVTLTLRTSQIDVQAPTKVAHLPLLAPTLIPSTIATISTVPQAPTSPTTAPSTLLQDLPNFGSLFGFDHRLKTLEANFSEFVQTNQFAGAVSFILEIVQRYMDQRMNEAVKGSCKSLVELEFFLEEAYKATTDQLDWINPEGQQYPHNLLKPLPLIPNSRGRRVIPFDHFINNDLEYLRGGALNRKYTTFVTKINAADYGHIKWIEDLFYGFAVNRESARDVYSKRRIIVVTELKIFEWHNYKHLDCITVRRDDDKLYKYKEGDFKRLRNQDIKDMLLLLVQGKLTNLMVEERFAFNVSHRMFTRSIVIQRRMEDLQLGVKSYQKKLNLTRPDTRRKQQVSPAVVEPIDHEKPVNNQELPVATMADNRTMAQLLEAPTEGYEEAIVVPDIIANNFEIKHGLVNLVQNKQFFGHDKEDPHAHIRYFNKITSTMKFPGVPSTSTTNLRNEITRFQQRFDESFYEAWDRFNDLLRACPHHGFSELHQVDTFYNALNTTDQDSLNSTAGGNFLDKMPRECLKIIESKSKVRQSRRKAVEAKKSTKSKSQQKSQTVKVNPDKVKSAPRS
nr:hypothetical protein [Tanacetum cinerariifolium]